MGRAQIEERIREMVDLVDDDDEPFDLAVEMLRLRAAHELCERGHLIEAAATLYGVQGRIAREALTAGADHDE